MGIGMPEVIVILVIALVVFGPRKLPELGKSFGQAMAQFRRASEDFKRTWEQEVELEQVRKPDAAAAASSTYDYNTSNDPYDPYQSYPNEPETTPPIESNQTVAADTTANQEVKQGELVTAEAASAASTKPEKHWI